MFRPYNHPLLHEITECPACGSDNVDLPGHPGDYTDCGSCQHSWPMTPEQLRKMTGGTLQGRPADEIADSFIATEPGSGVEYRCTPDGRDIVYVSDHHTHRLPDDQFWSRFQYLSTVENSKP